jgi:hypothetical protein
MAQDVVGLRPRLPHILVHMAWRGAVNSTRTFLIALEADPSLLSGPGAVR